MTSDFEINKRPTDYSPFYDAFACPVSGSPLLAAKDGLVSDSGVAFPLLNERVVDFVSPLSLTAYDSKNMEMYNTPASTEIYRNFLDWLFATFNEDERAFRTQLLRFLNLNPGDKVLITSVGLGDDLLIIEEILGPNGEIHAQDISKEMVLLAESRATTKNAMFTISNGTMLPYKDNYFDAAFHFGGINLFGDTRKAISELARVCRVGGRVVFGDESVAPHLRDTEYAKIAINNIKLWDAHTPLEMLPINADNIQLNYVLGNCFYVIGFDVGEGLPFMNIDIKHKGIRGGSARTRYFGQLEGVSVESKDRLIRAAKDLNISISDLLEDLIKKLP